MQIMMYIFLTRKKENNTDIPHISNMITYLIKSSPKKPSLLLFPEGTDLSNSNIDKNNDYARKNNLKETYHVLYPKPGGLMTCLNSLPDQNTVIHDAVNLIEAKNLDLIGLNIKCYDKDRRAVIGFKIFNTINHALKYFSPFAVGAFMLTRRDRFEEFGGFPENFITSEDYFLSRKYSPRKFRIMKHYFGQDSRRFKRMGYFGMGKYLVKNFINRNNKAYWDKLDSSKYWS
jgi:hypothetical protein